MTEDPLLKRLENLYAIAYAREYYNNNKIDIKFKRDNKCINNNK